MRKELAELHGSVSSFISNEALPGHLSNLNRQCGGMERTLDQKPA